MYVTEPDYLWGRGRGIKASAESAQGCRDSILSTLCSKKYYKLLKV